MFRREPPDPPILARAWRDPPLAEDGIFFSQAQAWRDGIRVLNQAGFGLAIRPGRCMAGVPGLMGICLKIYLDNSKHSF
jgi:hypothetical protein